MSRSHPLISNDGKSFILADGGSDTVSPVVVYPLKMVAGKVTAQVSISHQAEKKARDLAGAVGKMNVRVVSREPDSLVDMSNIFDPTALKVSDFEGLFALNGGGDYAFFPTAKDPKSFTKTMKRDNFRFDPQGGGCKVFSGTGPGFEFFLGEITPTSAQAWLYVDDAQGGRVGDLNVVMETIPNSNSREKENRNRNMWHNFCHAFSYLFGRDEIILEQNEGLGRQVTGQTAYCSFLHSLFEEGLIPGGGFVLHISRGRGAKHTDGVTFTVTHTRLG